MLSIQRQQNPKIKERYKKSLALLHALLDKNREKIASDWARYSLMKGLISNLSGNESVNRLYRKTIRSNIDLALSEDDKSEYSNTINLCNGFLRSAERGNEIELQAYLDEDFPVTWQDPETGETALHIVAAYQARKALLVLIKDSRCDFLLRDAQGRLPSEMAYLYGDDPAVARLLGNKERKQAALQGIKLTRKPPA